MSDSHIQNYITSARLTGKSDARIREDLLKVGWSKGVVDKCLQEKNPTYQGTKKPLNVERVAPVLFTNILFLCTPLVFGFISQKAPFLRSAVDALSDAYGYAFIPFFAAELLIGVWLSLSGRNEAQRAWGRAIIAMIPVGLLLAGIYCAWGLIYLFFYYPG